MPGGGALSGAQKLGWSAFAVMAGAQLLVPFVDDDAGLTAVVVGAFFATTLVLAVGLWGGARAVAAASLVVAATAMLEWVGSTTGVPFGRYDYTDALQPQVAGVPAVVPLAWWAMAVPAREVGARLAAPGWRRVALVALALTAWDLMLDPQMVEEGYWVWAADGAWRGIPLSNYAGWLVSSAAVAVLLDAVLPDPGHSRPLLGLYAWWAATEATAFVIFFGDPLVGVVGGLAMGSLAALAERAERGRRG